MDRQATYSERCIARAWMRAVDCPVVVDIPRLRGLALFVLTYNLAAETSEQ
jgi:hypothetical protein